MAETYGMTVGDLRKIIADLPDDMPVASYDVGGYLAYEYCGADVYDPKTREGTPYGVAPDVPYLEIGA